MQFDQSETQPVGLSYYFLKEEKVNLHGDALKIIFIFFWEIIPIHKEIVVLVEGFSIPTTWSLSKKDETTQNTGVSFTCWGTSKKAYACLSEHAHTLAHDEELPLTYTGCLSWGLDIKPLGQYLQLFSKEWTKWTSPFVLLMTVECDGVSSSYL